VASVLFSRQHATKTGVRLVISSVCHAFKNLRTAAFIKYLRDLARGTLEDRLRLWKSQPCDGNTGRCWTHANGVSTLNRAFQPGNSGIPFPGFSSMTLKAACDLIAGTDGHAPLCDPTTMNCLPNNGSSDFSYRALLSEVCRISDGLCLQCIKQGATDPERCRDHDD